MTEFMPKISIIIPVYNGSDYIEEAITSALSQTYNNYEIIVVNDGSTDDGKTEEIVLKYSERLKYIKKENGGVSSALNRGIEEMSGEYFSWLSHDDKYTPYKLENLVNLLSKYRDKDIVALSGVIHIDKNSNPVKEVKYFCDDHIYDGEEVIAYMLKHGGVNGCALLIPRSALIKCGGFNEDLRYNQDLLMWYQIFGAGYKMVVDLKHKDVMYRLHENQTSKLRRDLLLRDSYEMSKIIIPTFISKSTKSNNLLKSFAVRYAKFECRDAVNECIAKGKNANLFSVYDVLYLKVYLIWGKIRNILKKIYLEVRLK